MISVKSDTPLFSDICRWIMLPFHTLNKQCLRFDILKKKFQISFSFRVRARYKISLGFRLSLVCSKFKLKISAGSQLFCLKTTSHGKPDLKKDFLGMVFHVKWFTGQKVDHPRRTWTWICWKPGWAWKSDWSCTWPWPWTKMKFQNLIQNIKPETLLVQHVKGQADLSRYVREKGCVTFDTNRDTPCSSNWGF